MDNVEKGASFLHSVAMALEAGRSPANGRLRILSVDGAGIYGLTGAIWLRRLCLEDPSFLAPGNVNLFAGISAGAINVLLLAKEPDPRRAVLDGRLERFWQEPIGAFPNSGVGFTVSDQPPQQLHPVTARNAIDVIVNLSGISSLRPDFSK